MKNLTFAYLLIPVLSLTTPGCGGDGGGGSIIGGPACGVAPCGGDIVGTWNVTDVCLSRSILMSTFAAQFMDSCPSASIGNVDPAPTGSFTFNTDLTYSVNLTITMSVGMNFPQSCFPTGATCADLDAAFRAEVPSNPDIQSASCVGTSTCVCTIVEVPMTLTEAGTYAVSGSALDTTPTGQATADNQAYCVKDGTLTFKDATPDPTNPATAIVATKS